MRLNININQLAIYFKDHTLKQCAEYFKCSYATIKRRLKAANFDTSIHNHSQLAVEAYRNTRKNTSILTREFLYNQWLIQNKDTKTIAEELGLHYSTIRNRLHAFKLTKGRQAVEASMQLRYFKKTGYRHPGCHPDTLKKINKAKSRIQYTSHNNTFLFKSLHELSYALLLDNDPNIINWDYEFIKVPYVDRLTGKHRLYYVDFSIQSPCGDRWVEVKPANRMVPCDKYLYAAQAAKRAGATFRAETNEERKLGYELLLNGFNYDSITFINPSQLRSQTTYTLWFKDTDEISRIKHDHYMYEQSAGKYFKCKFIPKNKVRSAH